MSRDEQFVTLFREQYDRIYNLVLRMHPDRGRAQDITQDIFLKIYRSLESFEGRANPGTWIYSIAMNHCIDQLRKERSAFETLKKILLGQSGEPRKTEDRIIDRHLGTEILAKLSPVNRALLVLKLYLDLDYHEIGSIMGLTKASVGVQLTRARREARKIAERLGIYDEM